MGRLSHRIGLTLLSGLLLAVPGTVRSQNFDASTLMRAQRNGETNNLYGNNPFEQPEDENGEGQQQDTTKKERKIRKPLESYFFDDSVRALNNFRWHVNREYNRVTVMPLAPKMCQHRFLDCHCVITLIISDKNLISIPQKHSFPISVHLAITHND